MVNDMKNIDSISIQIAKEEHAKDACEMVIQSITTLCAPDYQHIDGFLDNWLSNKTPGNFEKWILSPSNIVYIALSHNSIIGIIMATEDGRLVLNYVCPKWIGQGVGKLLLSAIEKHLISPSVSKIVADSTLTATRFYSAQGFVKAITDCNENSPTCIPMIKTLQNQN